MMSSGCETHISRSLAKSVAQQRPELVMVLWFAFGLLPGVRTGALPALRPSPPTELCSPTVAKLYLSLLLLPPEAGQLFISCVFYYWRVINEVMVY